MTQLSRLCIDPAVDPFLREGCNFKVPRTMRPWMAESSLDPNPDVAYPIHSPMLSDVFVKAQEGPQSKGAWRKSGGSLQLDLDSDGPTCSLPCSPSESPSSTVRSSSRKHSGPFLQMSKDKFWNKWKERPLKHQLCGVIRHCERADATWALTDGQTWIKNEEFKKWPIDPPLSDNGLIDARSIGEHVNGYAAESDSEFHVIISSPYFRCIQTAVQISKALPNAPKVIVDYTLGEIFGPGVFGDTEPLHPVRPMSRFVEYCKSEGVTAEPKGIGTWPTWPEHLRDGRRRIAQRFLEFLHKSVKTRRNFLLVSHADGIGASYSMLATEQRREIDKVYFGGMFLARRAFQTDDRPAPEQEVERQLGEEMGEDEEEQLPRQVSHGWQMQHTNLELGQISQNRSKEILAQGSVFSREYIEQLIGEMGDAPLGETSKALANKKPRLRRIATQNSAASFESVGGISGFSGISTVLFGASKSEIDPNEILTPDGGISLKSGRTTPRSGEKDNAVHDDHHDIKKKEVVLEKLDCRRTGTSFPDFGLRSKLAQRRGLSFRLS